MMAPRYLYALKRAYIDVKRRHHLKLNDEQVLAMIRISIFVGLATVTNGGSNDGGESYNSNERTSVVVDTAIMNFNSYPTLVTRGLIR